MCKFEKNLNRLYTISGIILLIIVVMAISSCTMYENISVNCENCDEID